MLPLIAATLVPAPVFSVRTAPADPAYVLKTGDSASYAVELESGGVKEPVREYTVTVGSVRRGGIALASNRTDAAAGGAKGTVGISIKSDGSLAEFTTYSIAPLFAIPSRAEARQSPKTTTWESVDEENGVRRVTSVTKLDDGSIAGTLTRTVRVPAAGLPLSSSIVIERAGKVESRMTMTAVPKPQ